MKAMRTLIIVITLVVNSDGLNLPPFFTQDMNQHTLTEIEETITHAKTQVQQLTREARIGQLKRQPGSSLIETFEHKVK